MVRVLQQVVFLQRNIFVTTDLHKYHGMRLGKVAPKHGALATNGLCMSPFKSCAQQLKKYFWRCLPAQFQAQAIYVIGFQPYDLYAYKNSSGGLAERRLCVV